MPSDSRYPEASRAAAVTAAPATSLPASQIPYEGILVAILLLAAILCYGNMLTNSFVYDDDQQILQNPYIKSWHYLPRIFGSTVWSFVGQAGATNYYRPLMTFSFVVMWTLFGAVPFGFHLLSLVLHAGVVLLGFYAGLRLFSDWRIAWIAALLFAVHPVHTEAVDWISAYPDLQVALFFLATFLWYSRPGKPTFIDQAILLVFFALALLSKEPALMFVLVAIVYEHFVRPHGASTTPRDKFLRYLPLICLGAVYMALRVILFGKLAPVLQHPQITWPQTIYSALAMVCDYTVLLIWPAHLSAFHTFQASTSLFEPRVLIGSILAIGVIAATVLLRHTAPAVSLSVVWLGATIAPVLNARWMAANVLTERYLYLPSVGFCWLVAWSAVRLTTVAHTRSLFSKIVPVAVVMTLGVLIFSGAREAFMRNKTWRDDESLYKETLKTDPHAYPILLNLALTYHQARSPDKAEQEYKLALAERPYGVNVLNNLGVLYFEQQRYAESAEMLSKAIAVKPIWAEPHYNYGRLLKQQGNQSGALNELRLATELAPLSAAAHLYYAECLSASGRLAEADTEFNRSIDLGSSLEAEQGLSETYLREGKQSAAKILLRRMLLESPYDSSAHLSMARLLEKEGKFEDARQEYAKVLETDPHNSEAQSGRNRLTQTNLRPDR